MKNQHPLEIQKKQLRATLLTVLFSIIITEIQAQTIAQNLDKTYIWTKRIVNGVLGISTIISFGAIIFKMKFQQREAGGAIGWFVASLVLWGMFALFANEILGLFGANPGTVK